jgi:hypothetical protein
MPQYSKREQLLLELDHSLLHVRQARYRNMAARNPSPTDESSWGSISDGFEPIIITPPSPMTPLLSSEFDSSNGSECDSEADVHAKVDEHYQRLIGAIQALHDEVERAWVLNCLQVPLLRAPQLHLLEHFVVFRPHLFRKKNPY